MASTIAQSTTLLTDEEEIVDVWSRTEPKYRRRAALLLGLTMLLFAGLCNFTFWLRTGLYAPWLDGPDYSYWEMLFNSFRPYQFEGREQVTLVSFLLSPISVEQVPIQLVIIGLLLAALSSVPILVAILYRFPASVFFALMVAGLAVMPWLGITVLIGSAIASVRPFRLNFRYASALLGLVPVAIYLIMASRTDGELVPVTPYRAKLAAVWVLSALGSCVICAVALAIARVINYRPGGIAPLLAVLFAVPVILFETRVGRDELAYRILEQHVGPGSTTVFVNRSFSKDVIVMATAEWDSPDNKGLQTESLNTVRNRVYQRERQHLPAQLANDRSQVVSACDAFIARFPNSIYVPNVLYLKGRALDLRLNRVLLQREGIVQYYTDMPRIASASVWQNIYTKYPTSDLASFALHQLAVLEASCGRLDRAESMLLRLLENPQRPPPGTQPAKDDTTVRLFEKLPPSSSLGFEPISVLSPARRLHELITTTRDDPLYGDAPLKRLLALDPKSEDYGTNLTSLMLDYPGALVSLSAAARLASLNPSPKQTVDDLRTLLENATDRSGAAEVRYCLGRAMEQSRRIRDARGQYEKLITEHPDSCYARFAKDRLPSLTYAEIDDTQSEATP